MDNSEKLKNIAIKILNKTNVEKKDNYGFAIVTILMIISIVLTCIRIIQECNKSNLSADASMDAKCAVYGEQIKTYSLRRGWFTKMRLKKILRREMSADEYSQYGLSILNALLDTGEVLTQEEIQTLVEAANV